MRNSSSAIAARISALATVAVTIAVAGFGCGGDDGSSGGGTSNGATATSNGTSSNGTTGTSNGTTTTSNGTTGTSNETSTTSNGTTGTSNGTTGAFVETEDIAVCDPGAGPFSTEIENEFFWMPVGRRLVLVGEEEDDEGDPVEIRVELTVLDETEEVAGVITRVIQEYETEDGELVEVSRNFFAATANGTICYFGEDVDDYEDGELVGHGGAWRAGVDGAIPGIIMTANPEAGQAYRQEVAPGVAEDRAVHIARDERVTVPAGTYADTVTVMEDSPIEPGATSLKVYAEYVGLIKDDALELVEIGMVDEAVIPDFEAASFTNPTQIDNGYFPLTSGITQAYSMPTEDGPETIIIEVLEETREVAGIECRVVRDRVYLEGELLEDTHDWYAQDDDGNVWYMGEEVDNYNYDDAGELIDINHEGSWEAGLDVLDIGALALPGIIMFADPMVGDLYHQEFYAGEAEDAAEVLALSVPVELEDGAMFSCLQTRDFTALEPGAAERKYYAEGIGVVLEESLDGEDRVELRGVFKRGSASLADFAAASFTNPTQIDNTYMPWVPGTTLTYQAETEDGPETIIVEVLEETREVAGIECRVVRDRVYLEGELLEDTHDWYAQDDDGNVWYMGEEVDNYNYDDAGELIDIDHEGSWEAGLDVLDIGALALPGIVMFADPVARTSYHQEFYAGEAEDIAMIVRLDVDVELSDGTAYADCLQTLDWNPYNPGELEYKFFAPGVGFVLEVLVDTDETLELESVEGP